MREALEVNVERKEVARQIVHKRGVGKAEHLRHLRVTGSDRLDSYGRIISPRMRGVRLEAGQNLTSSLPSLYMAGGGPKRCAPRCVAAAMWTQAENETRRTCLKERAMLGIHRNLQVHDERTGSLKFTSALASTRVEAPRGDVNHYVSGTSATGFEIIT